MKMTTGLSLFALSLAASNSYAVTGTLWNALKAKSLVEHTEQSLITPKESIILPLSQGLAQGESELCWTFSTLSFLETHYLYQNPNARGVSLSRAAMQRNNAEERAYRTYILQTDAFMERGTFVNAQEIIKKYGLMARDSKKLRSDYASTLQNELNAFATRREKEENLKSVVDGIFFAMPETSTFDGKDYTPKELAALLVDRKTISFAFKAGAKGEWGTHPDEDAFKGAKSWYVDPSEKEAIIKKSLSHGYALEMSFDAHSVLLFGADYDDQGKAIKYHIKDSYMYGNGFTYEATATKLHKILWELGTVVLK